MDYLNLALDAWRSGEKLRQRRARYKDYTYGRQWGDTVKDSSGASVSELEMAHESGFRPHTNNLIRQLVKSVVGNFRANQQQAGDETSYSSLPSEVSERNLLDELDCRMLEEFLISGCAVQRISNESRMAGSGVWVDNVSPGSFFVNSFTDSRGLDIELLGMLHSMSLRELLMRFGSAGGNVSELSRRYRQAMDHGCGAALGDPVSRRFLEAGPGRCRVIELWTLESRAVYRCHDRATGHFFIAEGAEGKRLAAESRRRRREGGPAFDYRSVTTLRWHCRFLTPWGEVLQEFDSPYVHGQHPFVVKFYPLIDGEVHSLVEDVIDQQRTVNRLITLVDHLMSVSAKGALLLPVGSLAPGMTASDVGKLWAQCDSVIPYQPSGGEIRQVSGSGDHSGAYQLLNMQMDLFHRISGVSGALQGQATPSNTSAAMYDAQVRHSAVAILDLMQSFRSFLKARNEKVLKC